MYQLILKKPISSRDIRYPDIITQQYGFKKTLRQQKNIGKGCFYGVKDAKKLHDT